MVVYHNKTKHKWHAHKCQKNCQTDAKDPMNTFDKPMYVDEVNQTNEM